MSDFPSMNMMKELWLDPGPWANPDQAAKDFDNFIRKVQADAIRNAAIKAQEAYVAEQGGVGYARVRTDWLHEEANRIERGRDD